MKFLNQQREAAEDPGRLGIEVLGRFGNYHYVGGWIEGGPIPSLPRSYFFHGVARPISPESSYVRDVGANAERREFLDLFWVNDGYLLEVDSGHPFTAGFAHSGGGPPLKPVRVESVAAGDGGSLIGALEAVACKGAWTDRILFEILGECGEGDRESYAAAAVARIGWDAYRDAFLRRHLASGGSERDLAFLSFLCDAAVCFHGDRMPREMLARLSAEADGFRDGTSGIPVAAGLVKALSQADPERACRLALWVLRERMPCREDVASVIRRCLPADSQWWLHHALLNAELGAGQVADALGCAGLAAAVGNRADLAAICLEAACLADPDAQGAAWNAGWFCVTRNESHRASAHFARITRHYTRQSLCTNWPHQGRQPWPAWLLPKECFPLPEGLAGWPRITVITPSYNQGAYIEETILSILNQGYPNLQYIVVDGVSTDGTREVLERYRDRIDHLIIEKDNGQTEAINKGLRLADGDLVAWLNSDDMYAPGALHAAALRWMEGGAEVVAGICAEHSDHELLIINKPCAGLGEFSVEGLSGIFERWFRGWYFYQPEVFFERALIEKVGLLDETLHYAMDGELWMRFASAGARLAVVGWPFAFFRKHGEQKTHSPLPWLREQAAVRARFIKPRASGSRAAGILNGLRHLRELGAVRVGVVGPPLCGEDRLAAERTLGGLLGVGLSFEDGDRISGADLLLFRPVSGDDWRNCFEARGSLGGGFAVGWFRHQPEDPFEAFALASSLDVIASPCEQDFEYLRSAEVLFGSDLETMAREANLGLEPPG
jgi:GT2 family glycosyltransferase